MRLTEVLPWDLRISKPCCVGRGSTVITLRVLSQLTLEYRRPELAGCDLRNKLMSVWQWPGPQSCRFAGGGFEKNLDSSNFWIHMEVLKIPNVTWKAVKLVAFHSHCETRVRNIWCYYSVYWPGNLKVGRRCHGWGRGCSSLWYFPKKSCPCEPSVFSKHNSVFYFLSKKEKCKSWTFISSP